MIDYLNLFPLHKIEDDEEVYLVDFSLDPDIMDLLMMKTRNITWIDHHKTAIEKYKDYEDLNAFRGVRFDGVSACLLTYCYFRHMTTCGTGEIKPFEYWMIEGAPMFTKFIHDWDTWTHKYGDRTKQFIMAFNAGDFDPDGKDWQSTPYLPTDAMIESGKAMMKFRDQWAKDYLSFGFITYFEGYKCYAINLGMCNSEYFKSLQLGAYDIYIAFVHNGTNYSVSLYSQVVDVSEIAVKHGGGGHKGAAGFVCQDLPFSKAKE